MKAVIYVEGGDQDDASSLSACREAFRKLLEKSGFEGKMPRIVARGGRQRAYRGFEIAHKGKEADYVALLVDGEDPVVDLEKPWDLLAIRPGDPMPRPKDATDEQALLMATCMETWIVADRPGLAAIYGKDLQTSALPSLVDLEGRDRHAVQDALAHATRESPNAYRKGKRSFRALERVEPDRIRDALPSFRRIERILREKL